MLEISQMSHSSKAPPVPAGRDLQLLLLTMAATAALYARTAVSPLQETMRLALSLSDNQMALLQGPALALPIVVAAIPLGLVIDRYSRVGLIIIMALFDMVGSVFTALASNFVILLLARCLIGLAATAITPVAFSLIADLCAPDQRGRAGMLVLIGQFGGMAAAFALGGMLVVMSGSGPNSWRLAMLWLTAPLVAIIFLILAMREPPRTGAVIANPSSREAFAELWRYRAVLVPLQAGLIMAEIGTGTILVWAAPALSRSFSLSPNRVGVIMSVIVLVGGVLGSIAGGILADLCQRGGGPRRTITILSWLALLSALPAGLFAVGPGVGSASVLLAMFMTIVGAIIVAVTALFTIVVPNELHGLCLSVVVGANIFFGTALAPVTVSLLSGAIGGPTMIGKALALVCVTASLLGAAMFALGRRYFPCTAVRRHVRAK
jgi:predicted MFS family arabinose efflux permease